MLAPQWWWMQKQTSTNTKLTPQHGDEHKNKYEHKASSTVVMHAKTNNKY